MRFDEFDAVVDEPKSLVYRLIILHKPYNGFTEGTIVEQLSPARYGVRLHGYCHIVDFHRSEFKLPPEILI